MDADSEKGGDSNKQTIKAYQYCKFRGESIQIQLA
jgi:hypothetical protein